MIWFLIPYSIWLQLFPALGIPSSSKCKDICLSLSMNSISLYMLFSVHYNTTSFMLINYSSPQVYLRFLLKFYDAD